MGNAEGRVEMATYRPAGVPFDFPLCGLGADGKDSDEGMQRPACLTKATKCEPLVAHARPAQKTTPESVR
jgi:hypothetical protein